MISIINTCRADSYEGDSLGRYIVSTKENCKALQEEGIDYEYLTVEYCPFDRPLCYHERTKDLFDTFNIKDIVFDKSVAIAENLNPEKYYEYFMKNLGLRSAKGSAVLITNADIILPRDLVKEIGNLLKMGVRKDRFYRNRFRSQIQHEDMKLLWTDDLHNESFSDACICGGYSGDYLLMDRETLINESQGYDETNPSKRVSYQTNMDGELLWKLYNNGLRLEFMRNGYEHIYHSKERKYDSGAYDQSGTYVNKPDWGFIKYPRTVEVPDKLEIVHT